MNTITPRVFVSYAHKDKQYCDECLEHLGWLRHSGSIYVFSDMDISPGDKWFETIRGELGRAQIALFLISPSFLGSFFCVINEMIPALRRGLRVIPVLVRPVDFDVLPLSDYKALPLDALQSLKPIACWYGQKGRDQAWTQVSRAVRAEIQALRSASALAKLPAADPESGSGFEHIDEATYRIDHVNQFIVGNVTFRIGLPKEIVDHPLLMASVESALVPLKEDVLVDDRGGGCLYSGAYFIHAPFKILVENQKIISILAYVRSFFGGAHSSYQYISINLDLETRKEIELREILDVSGKKEEFLAIVTEKIVSLKKDRCGYFFEDAGLIMETLRDARNIAYTFYPNPGNSSRICGLRLLFSPYEMGSFAEGPYEVDIENNLLMDAATEYFRHLVGDASDMMTGRYCRKGQNERSEITILPTLQRDIFKVSGVAFWGITREHGPNMGDIEFVAHLENNALRYSEDLGPDRVHSIEMKFLGGGKLSVREEGWLGVHGMNVTFEGEYTKAAPY